MEEIQSGCRSRRRSSRSSRRSSSNSSSSSTGGIAIQQHLAQKPWACTEPRQSGSSVRGIAAATPSCLRGAYLSKGARHSCKNWKVLREGFRRGGCSATWFEALTNRAAKLALGSLQCLPLLTPGIFYLESPGKENTDRKPISFHKRIAHTTFCQNPILIFLSCRKLILCCSLSVATAGQVLHEGIETVLL